MTIDKEEFVLRLGGKQQTRRKLNALLRELKAKQLEIESLVCESYNGIDMTTDDMRYKRPFQLDLLLDSEFCNESPFGTHALSNGHPYHYHCIWCDKQVAGFSDSTKNLEKIHTRY